ncbi:MAG: hypothetical protein ACM3WS_08810, partial [Bacillota bacterium]
MRFPQRITNAHENRSSEADIMQRRPAIGSASSITSEGEKMRIKLLALAVGAAIVSGQSVAANLFTIDGTVTGVTTETQSYSFKTA